MSNNVRRAVSLPVAGRPVVLPRASAFAFTGPNVIVAADAADVVGGSKFDSTGARKGGRIDSQKGKEFEKVAGAL